MGMHPYGHVTLSGAGSCRLATLPLEGLQISLTPDEEFIMYIKDMKFQSEDRRAMYTAEELMV